MTVRLRIDLSYDGGGFAGWARQPGERTVQGVVEDAVATVLRLSEPPDLTVAGRTDAGVHARGQVCHIDVPELAWANVVSGVLPRLAGVLPRDVRVTQAGPAPAGFDARFAALSRRYAYRVGDDPAGVDPLRRHYVWWHPRPLDVGVMADAAAQLAGEHDFAAFCRRRPGATTVRRLLRFDWARAEGGLAVATVEADAFCHNMVRALVGALVPVGEGRRRAEWPAQVLAAGVRDSAVNVVPPHGLTLEEVRYPPDDELEARVAETRRTRPAMPTR